MAKREAVFCVMELVETRIARANGRTPDPKRIAEYRRNAAKAGQWRPSERLELRRQEERARR